MAIKDFSIFLQPVNTTSSKKDIGKVSGFNAVSQYIEHVMKTQKGELVSNINLGSDYFNYIFGTDDLGSLELSLAAYIEAAIPKINDVIVKTMYYDESRYNFQIFFSIYDGIIIQKNASCFVEVTR